MFSFSVFSFPPQLKDARMWLDLYSFHSFSFCLIKTNSNWNVNFSSFFLRHIFLLRILIFLTNSRWMHHWFPTYMSPWIFLCGYFFFAVGNAWAALFFFFFVPFFCDRLNYFYFVAPLMSLKSVFSFCFKFEIKYFTVSTLVLAQLAWL